MTDLSQLELSSVTDADTTSNLSSGTTINHYVLGQCIGRGSFGSVYYCIHRETGKEYAMKVMSKRFLSKQFFIGQNVAEGACSSSGFGGPSTSTSTSTSDLSATSVDEYDMGTPVASARNTIKSYLDLAYQEIEVMKMFRHPCLLHLYELIQTPAMDRIFMILELAEGPVLSVLSENAFISQQVVADLKAHYDEKDIDSLVEYACLRCTPMPLHQLYIAIFHISLGLQVLHDKSYVHADLKAANVLRLANGSFVLADFSLTDHVSRTRAMQSIVSPAYASPDGRGLTLENDIWGFGVMLFMMLFGRHPASLCLHILASRLAKKDDAGGGGGSSATTYSCPSSQARASAQGSAHDAPSQSAHSALRSEPGSEGPRSARRRRIPHWSHVMKEYPDAFELIMDSKKSSVHAALIEILKGSLCISPRGRMRITEIFEFICAQYVKVCVYRVHNIDSLKLIYVFHAVHSEVRRRMRRGELRCTCPGTPSGPAADCPLHAGLLPPDTYAVTEDFKEEHLVHAAKKTYLTMIFLTLKKINPLVEYSAYFVMCLRMLGVDSDFDSYYFHKFLVLYFKLRSEELLEQEGAGGRPLRRHASQPLDAGSGEAAHGLLPDDGHIQISETLYTDASERPANAAHVHVHMHMHMHSRSHMHSHSHSHSRGSRHAGSHRGGGAANDAAVAAAMHSSLDSAADTHGPHGANGPSDTSDDLECFSFDEGIRPPDSNTSISFAHSIVSEACEHSDAHPRSLNTSNNDASEKLPPEELAKIKSGFSRRFSESMRTSDLRLSQTRRRRAGTVCAGRAGGAGGAGCIAGVGGRNLTGSQLSLFNSSFSRSQAFLKDAALLELLHPSTAAKHEGALSEADAAGPGDASLPVCMGSFNLNKVLVGAPRNFSRSGLLEPRQAPQAGGARQSDPLWEDANLFSLIDARLQLAKTDSIDFYWSDIMYLVFNDVNYRRNNASLTLQELNRHGVTPRDNLLLSRLHTKLAHSLYDRPSALAHECTRERPRTACDAAPHKHALEESRSVPKLGAAPDLQPQSQSQPQLQAQLQSPPSAPAPAPSGLLGAAEDPGPLGFQGQAPSDALPTTRRMTNVSFTSAVEVIDNTTDTDKNLYKDLRSIHNVAGNLAESSFAFEHRKHFFINGVDARVSRFDIVSKSKRTILAEHLLKRGTSLAEIQSVLGTVGGERPSSSGYRRQHSQGRPRRNRKGFSFDDLASLTPNGETPVHSSAASIMAGTPVSNAESNEGSIIFDLHYGIDLFSRSKLSTPSAGHHPASSVGPSQDQCERSNATSDSFTLHLDILSEGSDPSQGVHIDSTLSALLALDRCNRSHASSVSSRASLDSRGASDVDDEELAKLNTLFNKGYAAEFCIPRKDQRRSSFSDADVSPIIRINSGSIDADGSGHLADMFGLESKTDQNNMLGLGSFCTESGLASSESGIAQANYGVDDSDSDIESDIDFVEFEDSDAVSHAFGLQDDKTPIARTSDSTKSDEAAGSARGSDRGSAPPALATLSPSTTPTASMAPAIPPVPKHHNAPAAARAGARTSVGASASTDVSVSAGTDSAGTPPELVAGRSDALDFCLVTSRVDSREPDSRQFFAAISRSTPAISTQAAGHNPPTRLRYRTIISESGDSDDEPVARPLSVDLSLDDGDSSDSDLHALNASDELDAFLADAHPSYDGDASITTSSGGSDKAGPGGAPLSGRAADPCTCADQMALLRSLGNRVHIDMVNKARSDAAAASEQLRRDFDEKEEDAFYAILQRESEASAADSSKTLSSTTTQVDMGFARSVYSSASEGRLGSGAPDLLPPDHRSAGCPARGCAQARHAGQSFDSLDSMTGSRRAHDSTLATSHSSSSTVLSLHKCEPLLSLGSSSEFMLHVQPPISAGHGGALLTSEADRGGSRGDPRAVRRDEPSAVKSAGDVDRFRFLPEDDIAHSCSTILSTSFGSSHSSLHDHALLQHIDAHKHSQVSQLPPSPENAFSDAASNSLASYRIHQEAPSFVRHGHGHGSPALPLIESANQSISSIGRADGPSGPNLSPNPQSHLAAYSIDRASGYHPATAALATGSLARNASATHGQVLAGACINHTTSLDEITDDYVNAGLKESVNISYANMGVLLFTATINMLFHTRFHITQICDLLTAYVANGGRNSPREPSEKYRAHFAFQLKDARYHRVEKLYVDALNKYLDEDGHAKLLLICSKKAGELGGTAEWLQKIVREHADASDDSDSDVPVKQTLVDTYFFDLNDAPPGIPEPRRVRPLKVYQREGREGAGGQYRFRVHNRREYDRLFDVCQNLFYATQEYYLTVFEKLHEYLELYSRADVWHTPAIESRLKYNVHNYRGLLLRMLRMDRSVHISEMDDSDRSVHKIAVGDAWNIGKQASGRRPAAEDASEPERALGELLSKSRSLLSKDSIYSLSSSGVDHSEVANMSLKDWGSDMGDILEMPYELSDSMSALDLAAAGAPGAALGRSAAGGAGGAGGADAASKNPSSSAQLSNLMSLECSDLSNITASASPRMPAPPLSRETILLYTEKMYLSKVIYITKFLLFSVQPLANLMLESLYNAFINGTSGVDSRKGWVIYNVADIATFFMLFGTAINRTPDEGVGSCAGIEEQARSIEDIAAQARSDSGFLGGNADVQFAIDRINQTVRLHQSLSMLFFETQSAGSLPVVTPKTAAKHAMPPSRDRALPPTVSESVPGNAKTLGRLTPRSCKLRLYCNDDLMLEPRSFSAVKYYDAYTYNLTDVVQKRRNVHTLMINIGLNAAEKSPLVGVRHYSTDRQGFVFRRNLYVQQQEAASRRPPERPSYSHSRPQGLGLGPGLGQSHCWDQARDQQGPQRPALHAPDAGGAATAPAGCGTGTCGEWSERRSGGKIKLNIEEEFTRVQEAEELLGEDRPSLSRDDSELHQHPSGEPSSSSCSEIHVNIHHLEDLGRPPAPSLAPQSGRSRLVPFARNALSEDVFSFMYVADARVKRPKLETIIPGDTNYLTNWIVETNIIDQPKMAMDMRKSVSFSLSQMQLQGVSYEINEPPMPNSARNRFHNRRSSILVASSLTPKSAGKPPQPQAAAPPAEASSGNPVHQIVSPHLLAREDKPQTHGRLPWGRMMSLQFLMQAGNPSAAEVSGSGADGAGSGAGAGVGAGAGASPGDKALAELTPIPNAPLHALTSRIRGQSMRKTSLYTSQVPLQTARKARGIDRQSISLQNISSLLGPIVMGTAGLGNPQAEAIETRDARSQLDTVFETSPRPLTENSANTTHHPAMHLSDDLHHRSLQPCFTTSNSVSYEGAGGCDPADSTVASAATTASTATSATAAAAHAPASPGKNASLECLAAFDSASLGGIPSIVQSDRSAGQGLLPPDTDADARRGADRAPASDKQSRDFDLEADEINIAPMTCVSSSDSESFDSHLDNDDAEAFESVPTASVLDDYEACALLQSLELDTGIYVNRMNFDEHVFMPYAMLDVFYELILNARVYSRPSFIRAAIFNCQDQLYMIVNDCGDGLTESRTVEALRDDDGAVSAKVVGNFSRFEDIERIAFDMNNSQKRGLGLGLAKAVFLTKAYGGLINVSSCKNGGTRIVIKIPLPREEIYEDTD